MFNSAFYDLVQKACLPGIWSKGVALARAGSVIEDSHKKGEWVLRVSSTDRPVSRTVSLWTEDEDWYCDCDDRNDVCAHVAAAVIALKGDLLQKRKSPLVRVTYKFLRASGKLRLERWLENERLTQSLVSRVGGIQSGRITAPPISVTQDDLAVDSVWQNSHSADLDRATLGRVLKLLSGLGQITLDGTPIEVNGQPIVLRGILTDEGAGYRLKVGRDPSILESFGNGAVLCQGNILRALEAPLLSEEERVLVAGQGRFFNPSEVESLVVRIIPTLEKKLPIDIQSKRLPKLVRVPPELQFEMLQDGEALSVLPMIIYPKGGVKSGELIATDAPEERRLTLKLRAELQLGIGQKVQFHGQEAAEFLMKLDKANLIAGVQGSQLLYDTLSPKIQADDKNLHVAFEIPGTGKTADPKRVFQAWRENATHVALLQGGWAALPQGWLARFGERIQELMAAKGDKSSLPVYLAPQIIDLFEESGQVYPDALKKLRARLEESHHAYTLPKDLEGTLRSYQKHGVEWLCMLRDAEVGAMLADDMGLGKTLQSLCAIQGQTLIVAPTSVLHGWKEQVQKFRPGITLSTYYGAQRKLDLKSDVILTSYAILRIDREILTSRTWDTVILDEAQIIKNPESLVARAAHRLSGKFRMALSGTPIENKPEDLWSQFQFLNPGLLGNRDTFQDHFSAPVLRGDEKAASELKKRIQPFFLRRLKKEVAPELPPKTETVLFCELTQSERDLYDAILASTHKAVLEKLEAGGGVFAALEMLLRLRQTCCHSGLIPGQVAESSSKVDLLIETLQESIGLGHRALVFSQWTSYLDLIEPHFRKHKISFNRLDGSTPNRQEIVREFQDPSGPSVMLISLKAGGVGLNLTAADHIFLMDPWWNPTVENQATDRAHRIGQVNPVLVHRLVTENTIEQKILELQSSKLAMASSVLEGAGVAALNREDLLKLLGVG